VNIHFYKADVNLRIPKRAKLVAFIPSIFRKEGKKWNELSIVLCSDDYLLKMNKEHLAHNYYTDIITFDLSSKEEGGVGEIYISVDRVEDNAQKEGVSPQNELCRVIFHGILHLCGYKDSNKKLKEAIHKKEDHYLSLFY
jgi:probable rRNA maturation factor